VKENLTLSSTKWRGAICILPLVLLSGCALFPNTTIAAESLPVEFWMGTEQLLYAVGQDIIGFLGGLIDLIL